MYVAVVALWLLSALVQSHVHTYPVGAYIQVGAHWCGVEIRPTPGLFCDVT
jgi:S-adenosylmethionine/arginine decarboxylase-like enzyme